MVGGHHNTRNCIEGSHQEDESTTLVIENHCSTGSNSLSVLQEPAWTHCTNREQVHTHTHRTIKTNSLKTHLT